MRRRWVSGFAYLGMGLLAVVLMGCGSTASTARVSPSPRASSPIGTATLLDTACTLDVPARLPVAEVTFHVVNGTAHQARFFLTFIFEGHTYAELLDYWNGPQGQSEPPSFVRDAGVVDVAAQKSGDLVAAVSQQGTYAFHCGYVNDSGKATAFWHELHT